jgi:hypothetical protein
VPGTSAETVIDLNFIDTYDIDGPTIWRGWSQVIDTPGRDSVSNAYGYSITFCFDPATGLDHLIYGFDVLYDMP